MALYTACTYVPSHMYLCIYVWTTKLMSLNSWRRSIDRSILRPSKVITVFKTYQSCCPIYVPHTAINPYHIITYICRYVPSHRYVHTYICMYVCIYVYTYVDICIPVLAQCGVHSLSTSAYLPFAYMYMLVLHVLLTPPCLAVPVGGVQEAVH